MDLAEINILPEASPDTVMVSGTPLAPLNLKVCCNTDGGKTRANVRASSERGLGVVGVLDKNDRVAVIVGGGPSLKSNWMEIFHWISRGADIFTLNGAAKFFNERCILPTYQVVVDPRETNVSMLGKAKEYLIASQCDPAVFDALPSEHTGLFHMVGSCVEDGKSIVNGTLIGGNVTVGLVAMNLAYTLGYREMHLYGYDSSYADNEHHAYDQGQSDQEKKIIQVYADVNGEMVPFTTNFAMAKQAELFPKTAELLCEAGAVISVHGTGLLPTIANSMQRKPLAAE